MTALAPTLQAWITDRLITQRNASPQTAAAYRDTFKLLLRFAHYRTGEQPFQLDIADLDAPLIGAFLAHLEQERGNSPGPATPGSGRSTPSTGSPRWNIPSTRTRSRG